MNRLSLNWQGVLITGSVGVAMLSFSLGFHLAVVTEPPPTLERFLAYELTAISRDRETQTGLFAAQHYEEEIDDKAGMQPAARGIGGPIDAGAGLQRHDNGAADETGSCTGAVRGDGRDSTTER